MMGMGGGSSGGGHTARCPRCGGTGAVRVQQAQPIPEQSQSAPMAAALQRVMMSGGGSGGGGGMMGGGGGHGGHR